MTCGSECILHNIVCVNACNYFFFYIHKYKFLIPQSRRVPIILMLIGIVGILAITLTFLLDPRFRLSNEKRAFRMNRGGYSSVAIYPPISTMSFLPGSLLGLRIRNPKSTISKQRKILFQSNLIFVTLLEFV